MDQLNTSLTWHNAGKSVIKTVEMQTNRNARSLRLLQRGAGREEEEESGVGYTSYTWCCPSVSLGILRFILAADMLHCVGSVCVCVCVCVCWRKLNGTCTLRYRVACQGTWNSALFSAILFWLLFWLSWMQRCHLKCNPLPGSAVVFPSPAPPFLHSSAVLPYIHCCSCHQRHYK